jgi:hypothetical protein
VLPGGFAEGQIYERGLILWTWEQSEYCQDLDYNNGGAGATPKDQGRGDVRGVGAARRRPEGSGVGASRGAKQVRAIGDRGGRYLCVVAVLHFPLLDRP